MLVDSDVLIWYLRGNTNAVQFLNGLAELELSAVSYMELVQGCRNKQELERLKKDLATRQTKILPVTVPICARAVVLVEAHFLGDNLQMADTLIAPAALEHQLTLATGNAKHFQAIEGVQLHAFAP